MTQRRHPNPNGIRIEQALFGYSEGHHLIAGSIEFSPRVRQFLANVTDSSGPAKTEGFETSYTGLPVPDTSYYALFCTWPAPEMPRPGCVWSHLLLLDLADLARVPDLAALKLLFVRPAGSLSSAGYQLPIELMTPEGLSPSNTTIDLIRAAALLSALYEKPSSGIVVLDEQASPWEGIIFRIWSQQWPRLRRSFSFSTGSLGDRRSSGIPFDLQLAPISSQRLWDRSEFPTFVVQQIPDGGMNLQPQWLRITLNDLHIGVSGSLRQFLFDYGSDVGSPPRESFVKLIDFFHWPHHPADDEPVTRLIRLAQAFPDEGDALTLKRDQLCSFVQSPNAGSLDSNLASAYFLLRAKEATAFNRVPFDFGPQVAPLWKHKRADVLALMGSTGQNQRTEDFRKAVASSMAPEDIPLVWQEQHTALEWLIPHRVDLASSPSAWALPESGQQSLWRSLRSATTEPSSWASICSAMLQTQASLFESETAELAGPFLVEGIRSWLTTSQFRLPSHRWREALRDPLQSILAKEPVEPRLLALAAWVIPASKARALSGKRSDIQVLAEDGLQGIPPPLALHTKFWLTALGLQTSGPEGVVLLGKAFFQVYDSVAVSYYAGESWDLLAPVLPELFLGLDWDRCRRLRLALHDWLVSNSELATVLQKAAPTQGHAHLVHSLR